MIHFALQVIVITGGFWLGYYVMGKALDRVKIKK